MDSDDGEAPLRVRVGGLSRPELVAALDRAGVLRNASAEILLGSRAFDDQAVESVLVVRRTVGELGLTRGATLSSIVATAYDAGLSLCPLITGPYLRLTLTDQDPAPDSVMSRGSAPSGSITVASPPLDEADDSPTGFYLRVVDGRLWLRGYHAGEQHLWSPDDCFAFRAVSPPREA